VQSRRLPLVGDEGESFRVTQLVDFSCDKKLQGICADHASSRRDVVQQRQLAAAGAGHEALQRQASAAADQLRVKEAALLDTKGKLADENTRYLQLLRGR
jgi:hypothetical protein